MIRHSEKRSNHVYIRMVADGNISDLVLSSVSCLSRRSLTWEFWPHIIYQTANGHAEYRRPQRISGLSSFNQPNGPSQASSYAIKVWWHCSTHGVIKINVHFICNIFCATLGKKHVEFLFANLFNLVNHFTITHREFGINHFDDIQQPIWELRTLGQSSQSPSGFGLSMGWLNHFINALEEVADHWEFHDFHDANAMNVSLFALFADE